MNYTITRSLAEIKLLNNRINKEISNSTFITFKKASSKKVLNGRETVENYTAEVRAKFQSINDLINRRNKIKSLIVESNANTIVTVGDRQYTVAGAIERKESITYERLLLTKLKKDYDTANSTINRANESMEEDIKRMILQALGSEKVESQGIVNVEAYRQQNQSEFVDPLNIVKLIEELEKEIDIFESEVDYVLSTSNSTTFIEVE